MNGEYAPTIAYLAKTYGMAEQMYAERHPSEPNYVALIGGDTFGIADYYAWYCTPGSTRQYCSKSKDPDYVVHLVSGANLATQLASKRLGWRAYLEDIPEAGSLAIISDETDTKPRGLDAAKHTGFTNSESVHRAPGLSDELVGFERLKSDLRSGSVPAFALIVPNQCNEMHGVDQPKAPDYCKGDTVELIKHGDAYLKGLIDEIQASPIWKTGNTAIVVTFDENDKVGRTDGSPQNCCVVSDAHNPGGGRIPTIVITNNGPRGVHDSTQYDHYSLLRTVEDAFGLDGHLRHAGDPGVQAMTPLFTLR